ncbi:MAG: SEC-C domain-containing protein, partial [Planctomycetaceae bacterium]|nr:SEC-C domain-containing protein [Planctomycetaceae bacterium]
GFLETIAGLRRPDDMIPYMSNWAMFQEGVEGDTDSFDFSSLKRMDDGCDDAAYHLENTSTIRYESAKIGRNEACPCGSGKKYKKCCGRK